MNMIVVGASCLLLETRLTPKESERKRPGESGSSWMSVLVYLRLKVFCGSKDCPGLLDTRNQRSADPMGMTLFEPLNSEMLLSKPALVGICSGVQRHQAFM